ncbi:squamosa promoter-binding protein 15 [Kitasatospora sp. NBC_01287]|uniref:squamosa promoter-binding protein 15 n=1 Tax=Kitasatospora sp. NBC_01287 TaxID=2903573 RepID=UPI00225970B2|nr:squamosa promoter-binding protein 15 [Kitasatospora sp. NBC_01287]MCX4744220.1 squamosa promoter-binding protein 15 [Kitasatospora sp. NBC_01287]
MSHVANVMISVEPDDRPAVEALSQWLRTAAPRRGFGPGAVGRVGSLNETTGSGTRWGGGKSPECDVYAGALNHADLAGLVAHVERIAWQHPEFVQLFVMDQEQAYFRVWMFHGAKLRQLVPEGREEES